MDPEVLLRKKLSKHNLEDLQDYITSLPLPDSLLEWISLTPTITGSDDLVPETKKRKLVQTLPSIAPSAGHKYSRSYSHTLYLLGIVTSDVTGTIPSAPDHIEVSNLVSAPNNIPLLSTYMKNWFLEFEPNEASLVNFLCRCLFQLKVSTSSEHNATILHEFSGPFTSHNLHELMAGDQAVKYPLIKRDPLKEEFDILRTPAEIDLRARSDFVFAASTKCLEQRIVGKILSLGVDHPIPGLSNHLRGCAVATGAEVKATFSSASFTAAKNQWSSLAYLQIMERVSISREATYVGDENICQYGYGICGLKVRVWKMGLKWNRSKRRKLEILDSYFTFPVQVFFYLFLFFFYSCLTSICNRMVMTDIPVQVVDVLNLKVQEDLESFITIHKKLLRWWLGNYIPSYVKDLTRNAVMHPIAPEKWRTTWQQAVSSCGSLFSHFSVCFLALAHSLP